MKYTRAYLVAPRKFSLTEVDEEPGEEQVLLKIASCGMCNWELNFWDGNMKIGDYPMKLGHEFAGEVVKVGPGVKRLKVGDRVSAIPDGHMADFVIEGTGVNAVFNEAQDYLRASRGRLILMSSHHDSGEFDFRKAVELCSQIIVPHPGYSQDPWDDFRRTVSLINNGTFVTKPLVSHVFKLSEIQKAFETLEHKPAGFNKAIVVPD